MNFSYMLPLGRKEKNHRHPFYFLAGDRYTDMRPCQLGPSFTGALIVQLAAVLLARLHTVWFRQVVVERWRVIVCFLYHFHKWIICHLLVNSVCYLLSHRICRLLFRCINIFFCKTKTIKMDCCHFKVLV